jgi:hypothetical protein
MPSSLIIDAVGIRASNCEQKLKAVGYDSPNSEHQMQGINFKLKRSGSSHKHRSYAAPGATLSAVHVTQACLLSIILESVLPLYLASSRTAALTSDAPLSNAVGQPFPCKKCRST